MAMADMSMEETWIKFSSLSPMMRPERPVAIIKNPRIMGIVSPKKYVSMLMADSIRKYEENLTCDPRRGSTLIAGVT